jgi:proteasome lid subunit RPN8/RPN11
MATAPPSIADARVEWDTGLLKALYELVFSQPDREVAGVLVGIRPDDSESGLPFIRAAIPTTQGFMPGQAALFVHETWAHVHATMGRYYRGLETVGWYVSRPGCGTAPTEADVLNHGRWFSRADQVLMIVDSSTHQAAVYAWSRGRLARLTAGPIARRYTRAPRPTFPLAGLSVLALLGIVMGVIAFVIAQALGG